MSSISDKIRAADTDRYEDVETQWLDADGAPIVVRVVPPSVGERADLLAKFPADGENIDYRLMFTSVLIATCRDPETGEPIWTDADADTLLSLDGARVQHLFERCQKAAGFDAQAVIEAGKDGS